MSFLAPVAFAALAIAIPILLLYMLRLRRREVLISSTFLWRQVVRDTEANTPWQRLRRNLLLFLQLLILLLLVLALAPPLHHRADNQRWQGRLACRCVSQYDRDRCRGRHPLLRGA